MKRTLGKWEQHLLLQQHRLIANHIPETIIYSDENLNDLLNRHQSVYVKHITTGQGRAILKIRKSNGENYYVNGFTIQGTPIQTTLSRVIEIQPLLHPFLKLGRESGPYIIQEDIQSYTEIGQPFAIRVHVQKLKNDWVIGGMYGTTTKTRLATESGIVNLHRGAYVMTIPELLPQTNIKTNHEDTVKKIEEIAIAAAEVINSCLPCKECGMDFGINQEGTPILFEVNTTPGIGGFAQIENKVIWKRIVEIRKMQSESEKTNQ